MNILIILLLTVFFSATAFSSDNIPPKVNGKFKRCIVFTSDYEQFGQSATKRVKSIEAQYNDNGLIVKKIRYNSSDEFTSETYQYDNRDNLVEITVYNTDSSERNKTQYVYDSRNNCTNERYITAGNTINIRTDYTYNSLGLLIKKIKYKLDGSVSSTSTYSYNEAGILIEEQHIETRTNNSINTRNVYKYDSKDSATIITTYNNGVLATTAFNTYDRNGNIINIKTASPDSIININHSFEYDSHRNKIREVLVTSNTMRGIGSTMKNTVYRYDSYRNVVEENSYLRNNTKSPTFRVEYIYSK